MAAENYQKQKKNVLIPIEINLLEMCMVRIQFFLFQIKVKGKKENGVVLNIFFPTHTHQGCLQRKKDKKVFDTTMTKFYHQILTIKYDDCFSFFTVMRFKIH